MKLFSRDEPPKDSLAVRTTLRERIGNFWNGLHLLWKTLLIIGVPAILAIPFYGRAIRANNTRNYEQDLIAARQALAAGRDVEARDLSLSLLQRVPNNNDPLPLLMHAAAGANDARLLPIARHYLQLNTKNKPDRLFAWKTVSNESPMGIAAHTWLEFVGEDEKNDADFLIAWLERLQTENLGHEIEGILAKQAGLIDPRLERVRLSMLAEAGTENSYRELQARLFDRITSHPDDGPLLIDAIDRIPQSALIPYAFIGFGDWLKARGGEPSVENQLRLARCEMAAKPETSDAVINRIASAYGASAPLPVARFYDALDRYDKAVELLKPLATSGDPDAFPFMAGILEKQAKLEEWDKLLATPPEGAFLPGIFCDRAFIASKRGDERAKTQFEQEALIIAEKRLQKDSLIHLARHASDRGMNEYALGIWVKAIRSGPSSPLPLFNSISWIFERLARDKQENQLLDSLTVYRAAEPGNLDVVTQHLYLACLIGNVTPAQILTALSPVREKIRSQPLDFTIAFANLLEGRNKLADELTGDTSIDWFSQIPAFRVIRAITLTKIGRKEEADIYMEDFPWDSMLPCETRVYRELLEPPKESNQPENVEKLEKSEKAKIAEGVRQAQKAKELMEIRKALEAKEGGKSEEEKLAEKAEKAEKSRLAEQARQAARAEELKAVRERLAAQAAKEAAEATNTSDTGEPDEVKKIREAREGKDPKDQ